MHAYTRAARWKFKGLRRGESSHGLYWRKTVHAKDLIKLKDDKTSLG